VMARRWQSSRMAGFARAMLGWFQPLPLKGDFQGTARRNIAGSPVTLFRSPGCEEKRGITGGEPDFY
jgi:hypothetical protein